MVKCFSIFDLTDVRLFDEIINFHLLNPPKRSKFIIVGSVVNQQTLIPQMQRSTVIIVQCVQNFVSDYLNFVYFLSPTRRNFFLNRM